jgi:hypothetical protein
MPIKDSAAARAMAAARKTRAGGRPRKKQRCPKCGARCAGARLAREHCRTPRATIWANKATGELSAGAMKKELRRLEKIASGPSTKVKVEALRMPPRSPRPPA